MFVFNEQKQVGQYFVLWHRDFEYEQKKSYGSKMLYDYKKECADIASAKQFALTEMPAIVCKRADGSVASDEYIVAAEFYGKYSSSHYDGSTDALKNYDVVRVKSSQIEDVINSFGREEHFKSVHIGIEERLF